VVVVAQAIQQVQMVQAVQGVVVMVNIPQEAQPLELQIPVVAVVVAVKD
jgi:hypothetical protein